MNQILSNNEAHAILESVTLHPDPFEYDRLETDKGRRMMLTMAALEAAHETQVSFQITYAGSAPVLDFVFNGRSHREVKGDLCDCLISLLLAVGKKL